MSVNTVTHDKLFTFILVFPNKWINRQPELIHPTKTVSVQDNLLRIGDPRDPHQAHLSYYLEMTFTFGFAGDDIEDEPSATPQSVLNPKPETQASSGPKPQTHTLSALLESLVNTRITFDNYTTPNGNIVYRRQLFDVKHQAMTEESDLASEVHDILTGTSDEVDLRKNVYEGGFKLWECSYDLVDKIHDLVMSGELGGVNSLLELGCGTALPSAYLMLLLLLDEPTPAPLPVITKFIFSDFNYEVLRLVTLPNILLHWASTLRPEHLATYMDPSIPLSQDELLLTPALLDHFASVIESKNWELKFISGPWGQDFLDCLQHEKIDFIVSSETIYSLETLPLVVHVLLALLAKVEDYRALIAAKQYYFGVGGSVKEFIDKLESSKPQTMLVEKSSCTKGQLMRDIVTLRPKNYE